MNTQTLTIDGQQFTAVAIAPVHIEPNWKTSADRAYYYSVEGGYGYATASGWGRESFRLLPYVPAPIPPRPSR